MKITSQNVSFLFVLLLFVFLILLIKYFFFKILSRANKIRVISDDNFLKGIDMVYWINLDRSPERRNDMYNILSEPVFRDIPNTRFSAIDGKTEDVFSFLEFSEHDNLYLNDVEYACLLSHLEVIRTFSESENEVALIMEDDMTLEFQPYWKKTVREIIYNAPSDWEIIQLSYNGEIPEELYASYRYSTGAYLINQKGAHKIMQLRENGVYNLNKHLNAPGLEADCFIFSYLNTYCYKYPMFIYKDENDSLLHDDHIDGHMESKKQIVKMYKYMEITNIKKLFEYYIL